MQRMSRGQPDQHCAEPRGELAIRVMAMPADTNPMGHIFGGWIMSMMDAAGKMRAERIHASGTYGFLRMDAYAFH